MQIKNSSRDYGLVSISIHWLVAALTISLFALGLWMADLDYYDSWYQRAPWLHKGVGVSVFALLLLRLCWLRFNPKPAALSARPWESLLAHAAHMLMNLLIVLISVSGYLIVTARGDPLSVFGLVQIPALIDGIDNLEDSAGEVHELLAFGLIGLAGLHALAALKHHLIDKDRTLLRMLGK